MDYIRDRKSNLSFSLHDSQILKMEIGKSNLSVEEFNEQYPNAEFEIVTEGYCGYDTIFQGWIWQGEKDPLFGIMRIWNTGDMIYRI